MLKLALVFGGRSAEHEISLASARFVADMLDPARFDVIPVGITRDGSWRRPQSLEAALHDGIERSAGREVQLVVDPKRPGLLSRDGLFESIDFAFPILHGPYGEDGTIQGMFELAGLPYAGGGVAASAVGMDKELMKAVFAAHGLPQTDYVVLREAAATSRDALATIEARLPYPLFVKPANLGSSVGMTKAHDRSELEPALSLAASFDRKVIVERAIDGRELECAVLGNNEPQASIAGEVLPANEFYDYESKYTNGMMRFVIPAQVATEKLAEVAEIARAAFSALDCAGFARCDFFLERSTNRVLINEINTIPGMTPTSGFPRLWAASGIGSRELIARIVELGLQRHAQRRALRTEY